MSLHLRLATVLLPFAFFGSACQLSDSPTDTPVADASSPTAASYYQPAQQLGELFDAVQMQGVFEDSKTFVDSRPKRVPAKILQKYRAAKSKPGFDLAAFVNQHFEVPASAESNFQPQPEASMQQHLATHWDYLTRAADESEPGSSLIPLPYPYVVPGGRFREIYYWDSYFTMHGLAASGRLDLVEAMLNNFAWLIDSLGHIPNGNRSYYLSRSQPPFFAAMVSLYQQLQGTDAAVRFLPQLEKEYRYWMAGAEDLEPGQSHRRVVLMTDGSILNRYYDELDRPRPESHREDVETAQPLAPEDRPRLYRDIRAAAESGWDFSSRWLADAETLASMQTTQIVPVDLNSLIYHLEYLMGELHAHQQSVDKAESYRQRARARREAINRWLWNESTRSYGDYHLADAAFTGVRSLAMVYPLYFKLAPSERATLVASQLRADFLMPGGLVSTLNNTGEQWDYPNGWAPLQWLAIRGLSHYGQSALGREVATRWLSLNRKVFAQTGRMMEKYNVVDVSLPAGGGEYPLQDGFGWTNGVALAIARELPND